MFLNQILMPFSTVASCKSTVNFWWITKAVWNVRCAHTRAKLVTCRTSDILRLDMIDDKRKRKFRWCKFIFSCHGVASVVAGLETRAKACCHPYLAVFINFRARQKTRPRFKAFSMHPVRSQIAGFGKCLIFGDGN